MVSRCHSLEELRASTDRLSLTLLSFPDRHPKLDSVRGQNGPDNDQPLSTDAITSKPSAHSLYSSPATLSSAGPTRNKQSFDRDDIGEPPTPNRICLERGRALRKDFSSSSPSRVAYTRLTSPDRFVPLRQFHPVETESFRLSECPCQLTPNERALRRRDPEDDPFGRPRALSSSVAPNSQVVSTRSLTPRHLPRHVERMTLDPMSIQFNRGVPGWNVGGTIFPVSNPSVAIPDGHGRLLGSGTTAPMYKAQFASPVNLDEHTQTYKSRIALALGVDRASRVLNLCDDNSPSSPGSSPRSLLQPVASPTWKDNAWVREGYERISYHQGAAKCHRAAPSTPFRVLDAPLLRDDYYCSTLAYCYTARVLAVGLGSRVYLWSELSGVRHPPFEGYRESDYVTSLSFSSRRGGHSILAVGRHHGYLALWSTFDSDARFVMRLPNPVSCVAFKHSTTRQVSSECDGVSTEVEDLVAGDETGVVWYYAVEWTNPKERKRSGWKGSMTLLAKISAHTQQICGLAWSPDGAHLTTGGNDNVCLVFDLHAILEEKQSATQASFDPAKRASRVQLRIPSPYQQPSSFSHPSRVHTGHSRSQTLPHLPVEPRSDQDSRPKTCSAEGFIHCRPPRCKSRRTLVIPPGFEKHRLPHTAAVKALAFAPWQPSLLATGGGSNDRCIRFYHVPSGSCLATISVEAQVTSLIWSKTRREIAATFGYAQPQHSVRIAVFAWPSCRQVVAIPWILDNDLMAGESGRALCAISYPGGPNEATRDDNAATVNQKSRPTSPNGTVTHSRASSTSGSAVDSQFRSDFTDERFDAQQDMSYKEGERWWPRTVEEGCIIIASSDESVKFHEVWSGARKSVTGITGLLGGSDILEMMEGIEKEGNEVIR